MAAPYTKGQESITQAEHISPAKTGDNIEAKRVVGYKWNGSEWQRDGMPLSERYDYSDATTIYTAEAPVGTTDAQALWTITKYDLTDSSDASGKVATSAVWDDRATEVYA